MSDFFKVFEIFVRNVIEEGRPVDQDFLTRLLESGVAEEDIEEVLLVLHSLLKREAIAVKHVQAVMVLNEAEADLLPQGFERSFLLLHYLGILSPIDLNKILYLYCQELDDHQEPRALMLRIIESVKPELTQTLRILSHPQKIRGLH